MFACYRALARGRCGRGCKRRARDRDGRARGCGHGHDGRARSFGGCLLLLGRFVGCCNRRLRRLALLGRLLRQCWSCKRRVCGCVLRGCCGAYAHHERKHCALRVRVYARARVRSFGGCLLLLGRFVGCCNRRQKLPAFGALALLERCDRGCMSRAGVHGRGVHAHAYAYAHIVDAHLLWPVCAHGCCNRKKMLHVRYLRFGNYRPLYSLPNAPGKALPYAGGHRVCSLQNRV